VAQLWRWVGVSTWGQTLGGASPKQRGQEGCGPEAFLSVENCFPCDSKIA